MLKHHSNVFIFTMRLLDPVAIFAAAITSYWLCYETFEMGGDDKISIAFGIIFSFLMFDRLSLYRPWRGSSVTDELKVLTSAWVATSTGVVIMTLISQPDNRSALIWVLSWMVIAWMLLVVFRSILRVTLRVMRSRGLNQRHVVLIGLSELGAKVAQQIRNSPWSGLNVVGYFDDRTKPRKTETHNLRMLGGIKDIAEYVEQKHIDQVWLAYPLNAVDRAEKVNHELRNSTVDIRFVLDIYAFDLLNHSMSEVAGVPVLNLSTSPMSGIGRFIKALEDRVIALLILVLTSPVMLAIAIGVKLSSPGPVLYRQERVSWNNKPFMMLKFRSMPTDAENESGPVWAKMGENRATTFGSFLRRTSLDELPQFLNVLKGDMSIVGPRPERPFFVQQLKEEVPGYMKKHMVKAGITGWAQVNGWRGNTDLGKRIEHDLYYINHWSLWFDLRIIWLTLLRGFAHKHAY